MMIVGLIQMVNGMSTWIAQLLPQGVPGGVPSTASLASSLGYVVGPVMSLDAAFPVSEIFTILAFMATWWAFAVGYKLVMLAIKWVKLVIGGWL